MQKEEYLCRLRQLKDEFSARKMDLMRQYLFSERTIKIGDRLDIDGNGKNWVIVDSVEIKVEMGIPYLHLRCGKCGPDKKPRLKHYVKTDYYIPK